LRKEGIDIDIVHADISIHNYQNVLHSNTPEYTEQLHEFTSRYWSIPRLGSTGMNSWRKKFIKEVHKYIDRVGSPDIIHAHTFLGGWVAHEIKEQLNIPYVITEHSTQVLANTLSKTHDNIANESYRHADAVLAVGQQLADVITNKYKVVTQVIPNFIDINIFTIPKTKPKLSDRFQLIAIGDLIKRKRIDKLLNACAQLDIDYHLSIIGDGPERASLERLAKSKNIRATFHGRQSQEEISKHLKKGHLLVHPSQSETFGIILIEAMATGIPVISFDNGGATDIITPKIGELLNEESISTLTTAIEKMYSEYVDYSPAEIRQVVMDRFSPGAIADQLRELYKTLT